MENFVVQLLAVRVRWQRALGFSIGIDAIAEHSSCGQYVSVAPLLLHSASACESRMSLLRAKC